MNPFDNDDPTETAAHLASRALFGNPYLMPAALAVLECPDEAFAARYIGRVGSGTRDALTRLVRLELVEIINGVAPRYYAKCGQGSLIWEIVEMFQRSLAGHYASVWTQVPLDPYDGAIDAAQHWSSRIDKRGALLLCDGTARMALLMQIYLNEGKPFFLGGPNLYPRQLLAAGMLEPLHVEQGWQCWGIVPHALWQLVPLMWQWLLEAYPVPYSTYSLRLSPFFITAPGSDPHAFLHPRGGL